MHTERGWQSSIPNFAMEPSLGACSTTYRYYYANALCQVWNSRFFSRTFEVVTSRLYKPLCWLGFGDGRVIRVENAPRSFAKLDLDSLLFRPPVVCVYSIVGSILPAAKGRIELLWARPPQKKATLHHGASKANKCGCQMKVFPHPPLLLPLERTTSTTALLCACLQNVKRVPLVCQSFCGRRAALIFCTRKRCSDVMSGSKRHTHTQVQYSVYKRR